MKSFSTCIYEYFKNLDLTTLPYDCMLRAVLRIKGAYARKQSPNPKDVRIVLGDINRVVEPPIIGESLEIRLNKFLRRGKYENRRI